MAPENGTCVISMPATIFRNSPDRCGVVPAPDWHNEFIGMRLGARDQFGDRGNAELGIDQDHIRRGAKFGDRRETL